MEGKQCFGDHEIFVVECVAVQAEGKVVVISICRHCGRISFDEHLVSPSKAEIRLVMEERRTNGS